MTARLKTFLSGVEQSQSSATKPGSPHTDLKNLHHFATPTLPHLLALLSAQTTSFPPPGTSLLVIDSVSILFALAFPKTTDSLDNQQTPVKKTEAVQWASGRRWAVMGDFISKLGRLAATKDIAVLLTSQMTTRIRSETGAMLQPAISGNAWETGIGNRIILIRDWLFQTTSSASSQGEYIAGARFASVIKAKGVSREVSSRPCIFSIEQVRSPRLYNIDAKTHRMVFEKSKWITQ